MAKEWRCTCGYECDTKKQLISHYRDLHPDNAWGLFDQIGTVGDAFMDKALADSRARVAAEMQRNARMKDYDDLVRRYNVLARTYRIIAEAIEQAAEVQK